MRNVSELKDFPFLNSTNCYIEIQKNGTVINIPHKNKSDHRFIQESYVRVKNEDSKLYVVYPGKWSADLFIVDDMNAFAVAFGFECVDNHNFPSFQWNISDYDKREGRSVWVDIIFACGFELSRNNINAFADFVHKQLGWAVSTSKGISGGKDMITGKSRQTITVRRSTILAIEGEFVAN